MTFRLRFNPSYSGCGLVSPPPGLTGGSKYAEFQSFLFWMWVSKKNQLKKVVFYALSFNPSYSGCGLVSPFRLTYYICKAMFQSFLFWMWVSKSNRPEGFNCSYCVSILLILDVG